MNIVLTGFMGTGKSVAGKILAQELKMNYVDIDEVIEKREKKKIFEIFEVEGEGYFRQKESQIISEVSRWDNYVISTGGGAVLRKENLSALKSKGIIICLWARSEIILKRASKENTRPLLKGENRKEKIEELLEIRKPYYEKADLKIETSNLSPEEVAEKILRALKDEYNYR
ncbi:MAG: shikimate kinase [Candidatus Aerophobetes bacterium]|nr:shikimate kinase [Candidatus Aerophobetes bacterium]